MPLAWFASAGEAADLPLRMLLVFGLAKLLAELAERIRVPAVVGGLLAGILLGPSALHLVAYDDLLHALAELGVMFLLFEVGLEVKASELLRVGRRALLVAVLGVAVPMLLGWGILASTGHSMVESIFMGAAMVATSVGITAQVLAALGLLSHETARVVLAAAVIDDILGLLVLAVVSSMDSPTGIDVAGIAITATLSVVFVILVLRYGTRTANFVLPKLRESLRANEAEYAIAVCFLFAMAFAATRSGVAAIVGAFLAGMALAETASHRLHLLTRGAGELMVPFFLASIGLQMDLSVFADPSTLGLAIVILVAAIVSKLFGCGAGAWSMGRANAMRVGLGMVPRGEVGMVVAQVGLSHGSVSHSVYAIAVFMSVATTIVAPPLLRLAYKGVEAAEPPEERLSLG